MLIVCDGSLKQIIKIFNLKYLRNGANFSYSWVNREVGDGYPLKVPPSLVPSSHLSAWSYLSTQPHAYYSIGALWSGDLILCTCKQECVCCAQSHEKCSSHMFCGYSTRHHRTIQTSSCLPRVKSLSCTHRSFRKCYSFVRTLFWVLSVILHDLMHCLIARIVPEVSLVLKLHANWIWSRFDA